MEHRVSDLSKAELCNQFADKLPKLVKQVCGGFRETLDDRMQSAWTELIYYAQNNQDLTLEEFIPRAMARVRGALIDEMRAPRSLQRPRSTGQSGGQVASCRPRKSSFKTRRRRIGEGQAAICRQWGRRSYVACHPGRLTAASQGANRGLAPATARSYFSVSQKIPRALLVAA